MDVIATTLGPGLEPGSLAHPRAGGFHQWQWQWQWPSPNPENKSRKMRQTSVTADRGRKTETGKPGAGVCGTIPILVGMPRVNFLTMHRPIRAPAVSCASCLPHLPGWCSADGGGFSCCCRCGGCWRKCNAMSLHKGNKVCVCVTVCQKEGAMH